MEDDTKYTPEKWPLGAETPWSPPETMTAEDEEAMQEIGDQPAEERHECAEGRRENALLLAIKVFGGDHSEYDAEDLVTAAAVFEAYLKTGE